MPVRYLNSGNRYDAWVEDEARPGGGWIGFRFNGVVSPVNSLRGGQGDDTITGYGLVRNYLSGGAGNDQLSIARPTVYVGVQSNSLKGEDGNDTLNGSVAIGCCTMYGGSGNDSITGSFCNDLIDGGSGNDTIFGSAGADNITDEGQSGLIDGGDGNDVISSELWTGTIRAGAGNDVISITKNVVATRRYVLSVNDGDGNDQVTLQALADHVQVDSSNGADTYTIQAGNIGFKMNYANSLHSSNNSADTIKGFSRDDTINLRAISRTGNVPLRWANNLNLIGNVLLRINLDSSEDLMVNCGNGILRVHFEDLASGTIATSQIILR